MNQAAEISGDSGPLTANMGKSLSADWGQCTQLQPWDQCILFQLCDQVAIWGGITRELRPDCRNRDRKRAWLSGECPSRGIT